ncbi:MAG TPA: GNAT family N-acetyltransferase [Anaerolineae bacterium]|nr:GNAT family N-acetyltransferase [Anaerolineae bacterium]
MQPDNGTGITTPRGKVVIRAGMEEDAPAYRALRLEALRDHPDAFSSDYETFLVKPMSYWVERLRFDRPDNAVMMFFAAEDGELIGMCGVAYERARKTRHSAYLVSMYVRPDWRGLGIADGLITACVNWAQAHGITILKLGVAATNVPAIRCYARYGFHVYGIDPQAIYHENVFYDELLMTRTI